MTRASQPHLPGRAQLSGQLRKAPGSRQLPGDDEIWRRNAGEDGLMGTEPTSLVMPSFHGIDSGQPCFQPCPGALTARTSEIRR